LDADVGEGAAHHHFVVATARTVGVEVFLGDLVFHQPLAGRAVRLDRTGGADVVGGDRIAEDGERLGVDDVADRGRGHFETFEIGRVGDVSRTGAPRIGFRTGDVDRLPVLVALVDVGI